MPLPFSIYIQPNNILVSPASSNWNLIGVNGVGIWGEIVQLSPSVLSFDVGDIVFYNQQNAPAIYSYDSFEYYNIIDEDRIFFLEYPPLPPP